MRLTVTSATLLVVFVQLGILYISVQRLQTAKTKPKQLPEIYQTLIIVIDDVPMFLSALFSLNEARAYLICQPYKIISRFGHGVVINHKKERVFRAMSQHTQGRIKATMFKTRL